ncbi:MAG: hypothetical protein HGB14_01865 [Anaerolineaceae bacterium]|nr:hypothetical protein [Anaerolineaceae bacterium]
MPSYLLEILNMRVATLGVPFSLTVKPEGWDGRKWNSRTETRRLLFDLAVEAVLQI